VAILSSNVEVRPHTCLGVRMCLACESRNHFLSMQAEGAAGSPPRMGQYTDLTESELSKCYWRNGWASVYYKQCFDTFI